LQEIEPIRAARILNGSKKDRPKSWPKIVSGRAIRSFHPLNYSLYISWLFPFYDTELPATRGAGRHKVQFLMRRQHQVVALAAPGHMVAKPASIGCFALFPLDRNVFIESGHSLSPPEMAFYSSRRPNQKKALKLASRRFPTASKFSRVEPKYNQ
jgi:hypothetical protein